MKLNKSNFVGRFVIAGISLFSSAMALASYTCNCAYTPAEGGEAEPLSVSCPVYSGQISSDLKCQMHQVQTAVRTGCADWLVSDTWAFSDWKAGSPVSGSCYITQDPPQS